MTHIDQCARCAGSSDALAPRIAMHVLQILLALVKMGGGLGLGWLVSGIFGLSGVERMAVLVGSALPPSLLTLLFAQENQLDTRFAATLISVAVPLALVILPLLIASQGQLVS